MGSYGSNKTSGLKYLSKKKKKTHLPHLFFKFLDFYLCCSILRSIFRKSKINFFQVFFLLDLLYLPKAVFPKNIHGVLVLKIVWEKEISKS